MKAVFLDRDGTINREVGAFRNIKQLRLLPGAATAIRAINNMGFFVVITTNQAVIARGWLTEREIDAIHAELIGRLLRRGAKIDALYYCPHHPQADLKRYRLKCRCRKPNTGMIMRAVKDFKINIKKSFLIGDTTSDMLAGQKARLKTILVKTGHGGKDGKFDIRPDFIAKNLSEAVAIIRKNGE
jgi:D,D-heptose 1,7-bisphosphate phosphatase